MKITTKRGDKGETSLLGHQRVSKTHPRPEAYGALDEANSQLGLAKTLAKKPRTREILERVQKDIFIISSEVAAEKEDLKKLSRFIGKEDVRFLEETMDALEREVEIPPTFVVPGKNLPGAVLDVARAVVRRAERAVVSLSERGMLENPKIVEYLNRLSDLVWTLGRYEEEKPQILK